MANIKPKDLVNLKVEFKKTSVVPKYNTVYEEDPAKRKPWKNGRVKDPALGGAEVEGNFETSLVKKGVSFKDKVWEAEKFNPKEWTPKYSYPVITDGEEKWLDMTWLQNKGYQEALGEVDWKEVSGAIMKIKMGEELNTFSFELIEKVAPEEYAKAEDVDF